MTIKRITTPVSDTGDIIQFPDHPDSYDMATYRHLTIHGYQAALLAHLGNPETTIVNSEIAAGVRPTESYEGILFPDLLIALNADPTADVARNGYLIPEQGKPPDFVLEVGSKTTGERDEIHKRNAYAEMGIPEYWRFDESGGKYHSAPLAGDKLMDGEYVPIPIHRTDNEHLWGHSAVLNLDLCWEDGNLRFWDPVAQFYLPTFAEERAARIDAEACAESERQAHAAAEAERAAAEARIRQLEEELRRRPQPLAAGRRG